MDKGYLCILFVLLLASAAKGTSYCTKIADLAFVIDSSSSIWKPYFDMQVNFVRDILDLFDLSPDKTRVSAVSFSNKVIHEFNFNTYDKKSAILKAISNVTYTAGDATRTYKALEHMNDVLFSPSNGARSDVVQIAIVLSDGGTSPGGYDNNILLPAAQKWTLSETQKAKDAGIFVFAIGIGSAVNLTELNIMASEPKSNFMIHVPSFQQLNTQALKNLVAYRACEVNDKPTPPPTPPPTLAPTTAGNQQEQPDCTGMVADVIFLVDESGSLGSQKNFNKEIGFVRNVIRDMDIGPKKTQVGLIVFADTPRTILQLNDTKTNDEIQKALKSVNWGQGNTFTDRALQKMMQEGFTKSSGARDGVPRIGVVITDGNSTYPHFTEVRADEAKAKNIHLFAIGIGTPYINELITIASKKENVYKVDDLTALDGIKRQFSKNICTKPQQDQPKDVCPGKQADVVIVSDASTSIGQMDFNKQLNFISDVVDKFDIGPDNVRVAMVTFSTNAKLEFSFTSFTDKKNLKEAILKRAWTTGLTFTDKALGVMIEEMKKARQNVPKICIVITDGWSRRPLETEKQASAAKAKNITMFSIGVGPYIVPDELDKIASDPSMSFMVEDYSALGKIQNSVAARTCSYIKGNVDISIPVPPTITRRQHVFLLI